MEQMICRLILFVCLLVIPISVGFDYINPPTKKIKNSIERKVERISKHILKVNKNVKKSDAKRIARASIQFAIRHRIEPTLVLAVIQKESTFQPKAASTQSNATGLMQVIPYWHQDKIRDAKKLFGVNDLTHIEKNIYVGVRVLRDCIKRQPTTYDALLCYNGSLGTDSQYANSVLKYKHKFDNLYRS